MLVSELMDDLRAAFAQVPPASDWRVGIATYTNGSGSDITIMYVTSYSVEPDDEIILVPEGLGSHFKLEERPFTAGELLTSLSDRPQTAAFPTYAKSEAVELPDGTIVSKNEPLWGTGIQEQGQLVYFYYGNRAEP